MARETVKERVCITLDKDLVKALVDVSAKYEVPVSRIINALLWDWVVRGKKWPLE